MVDWWIWLYNRYTGSNKAIRKKTTMNCNNDTDFCWCEVCEGLRTKYYNEKATKATKEENMQWLLLGFIMVAIILVGGYIDMKYYLATGIL